MKITARKLAVGISAGVMIVALILPALALAVPGGPVAATAGNRTAAEGTDAQSARLEQRIMTALQNRAKRFNNYAAMLERSQERLMVLCDKVEEAGGDCTQVREQLRLSVQTMEQARVQEQLAAQLFKDVADAADRRGAFKQARAQARVSVQTMKQSRDQLRTATRTLQGLIEDIIDEAAETESE